MLRMSPLPFGSTISSSSKPHDAQVEELYLKFLARSPVRDELEIVDPNGKGDVRDIAWHLMNSFEFLYRI